MYEVEFWGETRTYDVENRQQAFRDFVQDIRAEIDASAEFTEYEVYEVQTSRGSMGVLAASEREARRNAEKEFNRKIERAREGSDLNQAARDLLTDMTPDIKVIGPSDRTTYEVNEDGEWDEGEI